VRWQSPDSSGRRHRFGSIVIFGTIEKPKRRRRCALPAHSKLENTGGEGLLHASILFSSCTCHSDSDVGVDGVGTANTIRSLRGSDFNDPAQRPPGQTAAQCIEVSRIVTAGAFFLSIEFQATGGTAYLTNKVSFGSRPNFIRFERDAQEIGQNYVFGAPGGETILEANKVAYYNDYVTQTEFVNTYGGVSDQQYDNSQGILSPIPRCLRNGTTARPSCIYGPFGRQKTTSIAIRIRGRHGTQP